MAGADLFWDKGTVGWLLVADLFWEKSTAGWWLISQTNMLLSRKREVAEEISFGIICRLKNVNLAPVRIFATC
jgi:hypothetical protein